MLFPVYPCIHAGSILRSSSNTVSPVWPVLFYTYVGKRLDICIDLAIYVCMYMYVCIALTTGHWFANKGLVVVCGCVYLFWYCTRVCCWQDFTYIYIYIYNIYIIMMVWYHHTRAHKFLVIRVTKKMLAIDLLYHTNLNTNKIYYEKSIPIIAL